MATAVAEEGRITLTFDTSRFGVAMSEGQFDASTTIGEVHVRVRRKLKEKLIGDTGAQVQTYIFLRNATEAFMPGPQQTLAELFDAYAVSRELRTLSVVVDSEIFSG